MTLNRVVCLIHINRIHLNLCTLQLLERIISGEDQFVTRNSIGKPGNITGFGRRIVMCLTRVAVHHSSIRDKLKVLGRQLLCQQNTGRNNYNGLRSIRQKLIDSIKDTYVSFSAACGEDAHPFRMLLKSIESILLMGTELNHVLGCVYDYYSRKRGPEEPLVPVMRLDQASRTYFPPPTNINLPESRMI